MLRDTGAAQNHDSVKLSDHKPPAFITDEVYLDFDIHEDHTFVTSTVTYKRTASGEGLTELVLDAENPNGEGREFIRSLFVNGWPLVEGFGFTFDEKNKKVIIPLYEDDDDITVEFKTRLEPQNNTENMGFYKSGDTLITQCEAEGFRRITPFPDRPDVMARYTVRIEAPEALCPVIQSNGNCLESGIDGDRHYAVYQDPWPKPSYLFAVAGGDLDHVKDTYRTGSGRDVAIRIFTEAGKSEKARHALEAVKLSMAWDEEVFGCEYDLDNFNVVAVSQFNMGAMENKGLNVFNDKLVLADPETATDHDFQSIIDVMGHEYFHNYTGNRVTLENWFNLSLKEGLTVLREQMFTAFTTSDEVERIDTVQALRRAQFPEDDGPLAHPVFPQELENPDNIYSATVYMKGSEIIRMMKTMMGEEVFIEAVQSYLDRYDGQAVTIPDFVSAMEDVSGLDLSGQFYRWYTQAGRPRVSASGEYHEESGTYVLTLEQESPPTAGLNEKEPFYIPVKMALVDEHGNDMPLTLHDGDTELILPLTEEKQTFTFTGLPARPEFHSLFRGFSAPVAYDPNLDRQQLLAQLGNDNDGFNRWDAGQKLALQEMEKFYTFYQKYGNTPPPSPDYIKALRITLTDENISPAMKAKALSLPGIKEFEAMLEKADPAAVAAARDGLIRAIGRNLSKDLEQTFQDLHDSAPYSFDHEAVGKRSLKGLAIRYLAATGDEDMLDMAQGLYLDADNMTDQMAAAEALNDTNGDQRRFVMNDFGKRFVNDPLTIQKWMALEALSNSENTIRRIMEITNQDNFDWKNPNHVRSLLGSFSRNYSQFHREDGKGYDFIADCVIKLDGINRESSARLVTPLCDWRKYDDNHQQMILTALRRIKETLGADIKDNLREKIDKALPRQDQTRQEIDHD